MDKLKTNIAWHICTEVHIENYKRELDKLISCIDLNHDAVCCVDYQCKIHTGFFSDLYNTVANSCIVASDMCLLKTGAKKGSSKVIPGWNEHVQAQHDTSLFWHDIWVQRGRPHNGEVADIMRRTRSRYHYAVRYVMKEETRIKSNRMAEAISEGNDRNLWKEVHSLKKSCHFLPNVIDGRIGSEDIADLFSSKFEQLYNFVGFDEDHMHLLKSRVDNLVINMCMHENDTDDGHNCHQQHGIDIDDLKKCVNCMKHGKKRRKWHIF